ncbi:MAG: hypothetical protein IKY53_05765 [Lachnospiraceae bacterium]|nr:hypothetical protein [Lachnospiraceae bacterium]
MTIKDVYRIWAPEGAKWTDWVRPVPFTGFKQCTKGYPQTELAIGRTDYIDETFAGAALIVDLPGIAGIREGIALAKAGYRPIPVYNGTIEQKSSRATVNNQAITNGLILGAKYLSGIEIAQDALPAFLVDRNRLNRHKMNVSVFDNSWDVYHQDLPSADYFIANGISKIIVIGEKVSPDLQKIFYGFQKKKIEIFHTDRYKETVKVKIRKPREKRKG